MWQTPSPGPRSGSKTSLFTVSVGVRRMMWLVASARKKLCLSSGCSRGRFCCSWGFTFKYCVENVWVTFVSKFRRRMLLRITKTAWGILGQCCVSTCIELKCLFYLRGVLRIWFYLVVFMYYTSFLLHLCISKGSAKSHVIPSAPAHPATQLEKTVKSDCPFTLPCLLSHSFSRHVKAAVQAC
jgi:hypothetical protein